MWPADMRPSMLSRCMLDRVGNAAACVTAASSMRENDAGAVPGSVCEIEVAVAIVPGDPRMRRRSLGSTWRRIRKKDFAMANRTCALGSLSKDRNPTMSDSATEYP